MFAVPKRAKITSVIKFKTRELSSAGSEHLPYKQRVTGSNPVAPTAKSLDFSRLFSFSSISGNLKNSLASVLTSSF